MIASQQVGASMPEPQGQRVTEKSPISIDVLVEISKSAAAQQGQDPTTWSANPTAMNVIPIKLNKTDELAVFLF